MENNNQPNNEQEFLGINEPLKEINLPNLKQIRPDFLSGDTPILTKLEFPELTPTNHEEDSQKRGRR